ncbi:hypothetical protein KBD71_01005 [Candidatus Woesebacteria bacterium]|nr:hypothetical protein [Candidatus Woesebacteria bacterium]
MKKEVFIAVLLGLVGGLIITVGMYRARQAVQTANPEATFQVLASPAANIPTQTSAPSQAGLSVSSPTQDALVFEPTLNISGATQADIPVVILHNEKEIIIFSDKQGNFSAQATLSYGANIFTIKAMLAGQVPVETTRTVVYAKDDFSFPGQASTSATTRPSPSPTSRP